ncbi:MAG: virulence RhuM family protein [Dysgonamonadaceae bacterium]|nr:virulence RhuM family protein [Dysgonamonadaceae bacterium]
MIVKRTSHKKPFMGLTSWKNFPDGKIQKYDVSISKKHLEIN